MPEREHPFKKLTRSYHERAESEAQIQYEEGRVSFLLKKLKCPTAIEAALRKRHELERGSRRLTFETFNDEYPSFPILLGTVKLDGLHLDGKTFLPALMKNFVDAPFVGPYDKFYETHAKRAEQEGRLVGLVFPRKGIVSGLMIYTSDDLEAIPFADKELAMTYLSGKPGKRRFLIVRSFGKVIEAIHRGGHGWKPGD